MNIQPYPDEAKRKQAAALASNAMLDALLRYGRNHDANLVEAIRLSSGETGR